MIAVILSGFYGVFAYLRFPPRITDTLGDDTLERCCSASPTWTAPCGRWRSACPTRVNRLVLASAQETRIGGSWRQQFRGRDSDCPTTAAVAGLQRSASRCAAKRRASTSRSTR